MAPWLTGRLVLTEPLIYPAWDPVDLIKVCQEDVDPRLEEGEIPCATLETPEGRLVPLAVRTGGSVVRLTFDWPAARRRLLDEAHVVPSAPPLLARLPFDYNRVPQPLLSFALTMWRLWHGRGETRRRPYRADMSVAALDLLNEQAGHASPKPDARIGGPPNFFLTYDMDRGWLFHQDRLFDSLLALLGKLGIKATWFVVPNHSRGRKVREKLDRLLRDGHEVGMHGIEHNARLAFQTTPRIRRGFQEWKGFARDYRIVGFRAPWLITSRAIEDVLPEFFLYDSSVPTTSFLTPDGSQRGCCAITPFRRGPLPILPVTLPWEEELLVCGFSPGEILVQWREAAGKVIRLGGCPVFLGHWDPKRLAGAELFKAHEEFLRSLAGRVKWEELPGVYFREKLAAEAALSQPRNI